MINYNGYNLTSRSECYQNFRRNRKKTENWNWN